MRLEPLLRSTALLFICSNQGPRYFFNGLLASEQSIIEIPIKSQPLIMKNRFKIKPLPPDHLTQRGKDRNETLNMQGQILLIRAGL
jgi:hypothetical protein